MLAKNGMVNVFAVVVDSGVLFQVGSDCGYVEGCLVLEYAGAHTFGESFEGRNPRGNLNRYLYDLYHVRVERGVEGS